jgi:hypothetical protein
VGCGSAKWGIVLTVREIGICRCSLVFCEVVSERYTHIGNIALGVLIIVTSTRVVG